MALDKVNKFELGMFQMSSRCFFLKKEEIDIKHLNSQ